MATNTCQWTHDLQNSQTDASITSPRHLPFSPTIGRHMCFVMSWLITENWISPSSVCQLQTIHPLGSKYFKINISLGKSTAAIYCPLACGEKPSKLIPPAKKRLSQSKIGVFPGHPMKPLAFDGRPCFQIPLIGVCKSFWTEYLTPKKAILCSMDIHQVATPTNFGAVVALETEQRYRWGWADELRTSSKCIKCHKSQGFPWFPVDRNQRGSFSLFVSYDCCGFRFWYM